jgi:hypothetical protein
VLAISDKDREAVLEVLRNAQFVYGLGRYPKKQVLDDPADVKALRERLEAMRAAAKGLSPAEREKLDVPWADLEAIDSGTEAVWKAAKRATPKIIAEPARSFAMNRRPPSSSLRSRAAARLRSNRRRRSRSVRKRRHAESGLTGKEIAGLELVIQQRIAADESYFAWLRGNHSLPPSEWRKRRADAERARRAEALYVEKLFKAHSPNRS